MRRYNIGTYIWITSHHGSEVIKRFEELTDTHLHCDRGLPIPLSDIKRTREARGSSLKARIRADEWEIMNKQAVIPRY